MTVSSMTPPDRAIRLRTLFIATTCTSNVGFRMKPGTLRPFHPEEELDFGVVRLRLQADDKELIAVARERVARRVENRRGELGELLARLSGHGRVLVATRAADLLRDEPGLIALQLRARLARQVLDELRRVPAAVMIQLTRFKLLNVKSVKHHCLSAVFRMQ